MTQTDQKNISKNAAEVWSRIEQLLRNKGWSMRHLEEKSGVARSTLYKLKRGESAIPRFDTMKRLATAFEVSPDQLWGLAEPAAEVQRLPENEEPVRYELPVMTLRATRSSLFERCLSKGGEFDQQTNTGVGHVAQQNPDLFSDWQADDWAELNSQFGVGGELTETGVRQTAEQINARRDLLHKVKVLMETEYSAVATAMIETLYQQACQFRQKSN